MAIKSAVAMLPATRQTNSLPMDWSKTSSTGTRESAQDRRAAKGACDSVVFSFSILRSSFNEVSCCPVKRLLPSISCFSASSGDMLFCARAAAGSARLAPKPADRLAAAAKPERSRPRRDQPRQAAVS